MDHTDEAADQWGSMSRTRKEEEEETTDRGSVIRLLGKSSSRSRVNFLHRLRILDHACLDLLSYAHLYDYSAEKPGNGFRSLVAIIDAYFRRLEQQEERQNFALYPELVQEYEVLASALLTCVSYAHVIHRKGPDADPTVQTEHDIAYFASLFKTPIELAEPIAGSAGGFQYEGVIGTAVYWLLFGLHVADLPIKESFMMLINGQYFVSRLCQSAATPSISLIKALTPNRIARGFLHVGNFLSCLVMGAAYKRLQVPRHTSQWVLRVPDWKTPAVLEKSEIVRDGSLKCLLVDPYSSANTSKSILIHGHGGAFLTCAPDVFVLKSLRLAKKIGMPILLPEYAKAPEQKFPAGVQDMLDLYLFLQSGHQAVIDMIGFHPENIFLSGDSAGANLVIAVTYCVNEIRKRGHAVRMPRAIMTQYPAVIPSFIAVPSFSFMLVDLVLPRGPLCLAGSMYADVDPVVRDEQWFRAPDSMYTVRRFSHRLKDPLFNLLAFKRWDDLKEVPLSICAGQMDPLLDQSIMLAKRWAGPVTLDIASGMPHAFTELWMAGSLSKQVAIYERHIVDAVHAALTR